ncbi:MAG: hypothetical protein ACK4MG_04260 [Aquabacterium sp.]
MPGDQADMLSRLKAVLPRWFPDASPILDAVLAGWASAHAAVYDLIRFGELQARIRTATDGWLDMIASDFFGNTLVRAVGQSDRSFRNRILVNLLRERATRNALRQVLLDVTGREPVIIEPTRPADCGGYGRAVSVSQPGVTTLWDGAGLTYVPPNTARYQGGALMIEPAATNLLTYTEQVDAAAWAYVSATVAANASTAPDGRQAADVVTFSSVVNARVDQAIGVAAVAGQTFTYSVWLRGSGTISIAVNTTTGVGGSGEAQVTLTGAWNRYSVSVTYQSGVTGNVRVHSVIRRSASDTLVVEMWGAQLEAGGVATSYVPSYAIQGVRVADVLVSAPLTTGAPPVAYGLAGAYGSMATPFQCFVQAKRPASSGIPMVGGYGTPALAYTTPSSSKYASISEAAASASDADIYAAIDSVRPAGTTVWANIST